MIAKFALSLKTLRDDAFQLRRRLDAQPDGLRGPRPLDHFVEHQADAPDVGAMIHGLAAGLLRRHVGGCAHHDTLPRAGNRGHVRLRCGRPALGEAEIEDLHVVARPDEDVFGFDIAVDDACSVRGVQRGGDLRAHVEGCVQAQRTGGEPIFQRRALQILHDDERPLVLLADVVDGADVRVVECRCRPRLAREPVQGLAVAREFVGDELESHRTAEPRIFGFVQHAHAACADPLDDAVVRERLTDERIAAGLMSLPTRAPVSCRAARSIAGAPRKLPARSCAASSERTSCSSCSSPPQARPQKDVSLRCGTIQRRLQELIDVVPAFGVHLRFTPVSSR